ncbi:MAG: nitroreductase family protein [Novipirellula sp. JB048]
MNHSVLNIPLNLLRKVKRRIGFTTRQWCSRNILLARVYYAFFNASFAQEQIAVLAGACAYGDSLKTAEGSMALLRRNIHRIEKGLLMRPRRVPFALDYIDETVDAFFLAKQTPNFDPLELRWAFDVLREYAHVCSSSHERLEGLAERLAQAYCTASTGTRSLVPYHRDLATPPPVAYEELMALAVRRRSVRWFLQKPVPRELIDQAIILAAEAPSACNRQPFEFRVLDDPTLVQKAISIPFGLAGYGHNVPCLVVLVGKQRNFFSERDRHLVYIDGSLASMSLLLALETLGLSSCCVNWPEIVSNNLKMSSLLGLASDERPVMLIAVGFPDPDGMVARSTKKSLDSIRRFNFE